MIEITLPDGSIREFEKETNGLEIAKSISQGLLKSAVAIKINGELSDLTQVITKGSKVEVITPKSEESVEILRHTTAHVFAQAVLRLFPEAKITIGPSIDNGFYYDVDYDDLTEDKLEAIEKEMQKIIYEDLEITVNYKSLDEAKKHFYNNQYKQEIIDSIASGSLSDEEKKEGSIRSGKFKFYKQGEFEDICTGPHLPRTGLVKAFKLEKITRAYWRADSKNKQLFRVYGTAFWKKSQMDEYFEMLEEAKKRDHRILGSRMKLFTISEMVGAGLPLFGPKGTVLRKEIEDFLWSLHKKRGYTRVWTPHIAKSELYKQSGHYEHYKENFKAMGKDKEEFMLKPMNCPHHMQIFADNYFSYKDMPVRYFEPATVYRDELSGTLSGLTRVRAVTQDDGHLFCRKDQIKKEVEVIVEIIKEFYEVMGMAEDYWVSLSVRDKGNKKDYVGSDDVWDIAESVLEEIAKELGVDYKKVEGEAAFYGPKLDFMFKDAIGREHQLSTIQLDFNLPDKFELFYIDEDAKKQRPIVIHRAIAGSLERSIGVLIEHFAGKFPLWLSPTQIKIINVADRHVKYCEKIKSELEKLDFRVSSGYENEGVSKKIAMSRDEEKPNYTLIIGDKDEKNKTISVRTRKFENGKNEEFTTTLKEFIQRITEEREKKEIYF